MHHANLDTFVAAIRHRLAKEQPDYHGIAQELYGAQCMALALGHEGAASLIRDLHTEVTDAWRQTTEQTA